MPGGYVPYEQDFPGAVLLWVEEGLPEETMIASARLDNETLRQRSLYVYPTRNHYRGDVNVQQSYEPAG